MGFWSSIVKAADNALNAVSNVVTGVVSTVTNVVANTASAFVNSFADSTTTVVSRNVVSSELQKIQESHNLQKLEMQYKYELEKQEKNNKMITTVHENLTNTVKSNVASFLKAGENISNELINNTQTAIQNMKDNNVNFYDFLRNIIIILLSYYIWCLNLATKFHDIFIQFIIISSSIICIAIILKMVLPIVDKENDRKSKLELEVIREGYKIVESSSKDSTKVVCDANESSTKSIKVVTDYVENNYHGKLKEETNRLTE